MSDEPELLTRYVHTKQTERFKEELSDSKYFTAPVDLIHAGNSLRMCQVQQERMRCYNEIYKFMECLGLKKSTDTAYIRDMCNIVNSVEHIMIEKKLALTQEGVWLMRMFSTAFDIEVKGIPENAATQSLSDPEHIKSTKLIDIIVEDAHCPLKTKEKLAHIVDVARNSQRLLDIYAIIWRKYVAIKEKERARAAEIPQ